MSRPQRRPRIVGVGGGVASAAAIAELRKAGFDGDITLVSAEDTVPYERPPLSKEFLLGRSGPVPVKDLSWYQQNAVELRLGVRATRLDLAARTVTLSDGSVLSYDQLLLATGVRPRVLPGVDGEGVCYLRTVQDAAELRDRITAAGHVAVLGGGFIGCEVASAAIQLGKRATILEALPTLLYCALGPDLGQVVAGIHRDAGVDVRTGQPVTGVAPRPGGGVRIRTGDVPVDADVLVVGVGTVPNQELAAQAACPPGTASKWTSISRLRYRASGPSATSWPSTCPGTGAGSGSSITTPPSATGAPWPATCWAGPSRSAMSTGSGPTSSSTPFPARPGP